MINQTIHTYGYFDALYNALQALAMFRNSGFYTTIVNLMAVLTVTYYAVRIANSGQWHGYVRKVFGMCILINVLLLPKTNMLLKDHITKNIATIDNIPLAFALPVGMIEEFGYLITRGFEQAFRPFSNDEHFEYFNYGMVFGARLKREMNQVRIKDPEFVGNMHNFIKRCVILPAMIGHQFTKESLMATDDMWGLVKKNAGTLTRIDMNVGSNRMTMNCKDAADYFEKESWGKEYSRIFNKYKNTDFAKANRGELYTSSASSAANDAILPKFFNKSVKAIYGNNVSAEDSLKQQMMINSVAGFKSSNYGAGRARMQQESSSILSGDLATVYLPMMLVIFKCIVYSSFIFLVPMLIIGGGWQKYQSYLVIVISLQLWPALNAVLNMIIETYSNLPKGSSLLVSYSSASTISNRVDTIVSVAAGLQAVIPFLAVWITNLGAGGISHLAGSIIGGMQQAANAVGGEIATNNKSLDNHNVGNTQRNMHNANKSDYNMQYFEGVNHGQYSDGSIGKLNQDGKAVFSSGAGISHSTGSNRFNIESSTQNQLSQGAQHQKALQQSDARSFSNAKSNTFATTADFVAHAAQHEHAGHSINYDTLGEQGKAIQQAVNHTKQLHEKDGYGWGQSADAALKGAITIKPPVGKLVGALTGFVSAAAGIEASGSVEGSVSARNLSDQSVGEDTLVNRDNHTNETYNNIVKAASNSNWAKENNLDTSYSDSVRSSYEEQNRLEQQMSARQETIDTYHQAQTQVASNGATRNMDMYPQVERKLQEVFGLSAHDAHNMIERGDAGVDQVWNKIVSEETGAVLAQVEATKHRVSGSGAAKTLDNFTEEYKGQISTNPTNEAEQAAQNAGLDHNKIKENIQKSAEDLKKKQTEITFENSVQYSSVKKANEMEENELQKLVDKYEEDRIGKGLASKVIGGTTDFFVDQKLGGQIGAPDKYLRKNYNKSAAPFNSVKESTEQASNVNKEK